MVNSQRIVIVSLQCEACHTTEFTWERIADNRNHTYCSQCNQRESNTVIPRNHIKVFRLVLDDIVHLGDIARSLLDSYDILEIASQTESGFSSHVHTCTTWHIIKHDRQIGSFGHSLVMLVNTFLRRLIIIRYNHQQGVYPSHIIILYGVHYRLGAVATHSQQDRNTAVHTLDNGALHLLLLFFGKCRSFCGCTKHTQEIRTVLHLIINQTEQRIVVYTVIFFERGNQGHPHAFQSCSYHKFKYSFLKFSQMYNFFPF